ncbi:hypothetical protein DFJ63DRAFT_68340 [Scheffersomyces coipomensis]|uniref:uncharacterized protein n=1 Tax=Scheffersomyces coipomensis TaxID=1788519 RepID=UPI00315CE4E0
MMTSLQSPFSFSFPNSYPNNTDTPHKSTSLPNANYLPTPSSSKAHNNINSNDSININSNDNDTINTNLNDNNNDDINPENNSNNYDLLIGKLNIMKSKLNKLDSNNIVGELKQLIEESYQLIKSNDNLTNDINDNGNPTNYINNGFTFTPVRNNNNRSVPDATMSYSTPPPSSTNDDIFYQTPINKIINSENLFKRQRHQADLDDMIDWGKDDLDHFKYVANDPRHIKDILRTSTSTDNYTTSITTDSNLEHQFEINFELN